MSWYCSLCSGLLYWICSAVALNNFMYYSGVALFPVYPLSLRHTHNLYSMHASIFSLVCRSIQVVFCVLWLAAYFLLSKHWFALGYEKCWIMPLILLLSHPVLCCKYTIVWRSQIIDILHSNVYSMKIQKIDVSLTQKLRNVNPVASLGHLQTLLVSLQPVPKLSPEIWTKLWKA